MAHIGGEGHQQALQLLREELACLRQTVGGKKESELADIRDYPLFDASC
jgi:hypothetical protein